MPTRRVIEPTSRPTSRPGVSHWHGSWPSSSAWASRSPSPPSGSPPSPDGPHAAPRTSAEEVAHRGALGLELFGGHADAVAGEFAVFEAFHHAPGGPVG